MKPLTKSYGCKMISSDKKFLCTQQQKIETFSIDFCKTYWEIFHLLQLQRSKLGELIKPPPIEPCATFLLLSPHRSYRNLFCVFAYLCSLSTKAYMAVGRDWKDRHLLDSKILSSSSRLHYQILILVLQRGEERRVTSFVFSTTDWTDLITRLELITRH